MAKYIEWVAPENHPLVAGRTFRMGRPMQMPNGKPGVYFGPEKIGGKTVPLFVGTDDKPELARAVREYLAVAAAEEEESRVESLSLPRVRARLLGELNDLFAAEDSRREAAWAAGDEAGTFTGGAANEKQIAAAQQAIIDFDVAHPEVLAAKKARQRADADEFLQNGN